MAKFCLSCTIFLDISTAVDKGSFSSQGLRIRVLSMELGGEGLNLVTHFLDITRFG